jgi:hypothetical protein
VICVADNLNGNRIYEHGPTFNSGLRRGSLCRLADTDAPLDGPVQSLRVYGAWNVLGGVIGA